MLSLAKQQLFKDTIIKLILEIRNLRFLIQIVKDWANSIPSLYGVYKQAKSILVILQIQVQLQKSRE